MCTLFVVVVVVFGKSLIDGMVFCKHDICVMTFYRYVITEIKTHTVRLRNVLFNVLCTLILFQNASIQLCFSCCLEFCLQLCFIRFPPLTECGYRELTAAEGDVGLPSYSDYWPNGVCVWNITVSPDHLVELTIHTLYSNTMSTHNCSTSFLEVLAIFSLVETTLAR